MGEPRPRKGLAVVVAALCGLAVLAGCSSAAPARADQSPGRILADALAAAKAAGSAHVDIVYRSSPVSLAFSDDSASSVGRQVITTSNGGRLTALVVAGVGYSRGNAAGLVVFGWSRPRALLAAGRWISYRPGQPGYADAVAEVTLGSLITWITLTGRLTRIGPTTVDGRSVVGVRGRTPAIPGLSPGGATATLYVAAAGRPLPVSFTEAASHGTMTFSRWGEPVRVAAPAGAIPITSAPPTSAPPQAA